MSDLTLSRIRSVLLAKPKRILPPGPGRTLACVAVVLAGAPERPNVCLIRRAEQAGDPWSGHMALPGGRAETFDATAEAVAERETAEEVGLRLRPENLIAPLAEMPVRASGRDMLMTLAAFVYSLEGTPPPLVLQKVEVAQALWVPLEQVYDPASRTRYRFNRNGASLDFPGVSLEGHTVWGLTYRVLSELGDRLGLPLPQE